jgi:hypothetical protein
VKWSFWRRSIRILYGSTVSQCPRTEDTSLMRCVWDREQLDLRRKLENEIVRSENDFVKRRRDSTRYGRRRVCDCVVGSEMRKTNKDDKTNNAWKRKRRIAEDTTFGMV